MEKSSKKLIFTYLIAAAAGVLLHFLFQWLPSPVTALVSPVRESVWEHVKLLYFPLLATALILGRGGQGMGRTPWLLSTVFVCAALAGTGYLYHIILRGESLYMDMALYFLLLGLGFLLPRVLWPLCEWPGTGKAAVALSALLGALILWFTFFPPDTALFADLSQAVRTFLTIPV